jgi:hypothetical protein
MDKSQQSAPAVPAIAPSLIRKFLPVDNRKNFSTATKRSQKPVIPEPQTSLLLKPGTT